MWRPASPPRARPPARSPPLFGPRGSRGRRLARSDADHDGRGDELRRVVEDSAGEAAAQFLGLHAASRLERRPPGPVAFAEAFGADLDVVAGVDRLEELGLLVGRKIAIGAVIAD